MYIIPEAKAGGVGSRQVKDKLMDNPFVLHSLSDGKPIAISRQYVAAVRPLFEDDRVGAVIYMASGVRHEVNEAFELTCVTVWPDFCR